MIKVRILFMALLLAAVSLSGMESARDLSKNMRRSRDTTIKKDYFSLLPQEILGQIVVKLLRAYSNLEGKLKALESLSVVNKSLNQLLESKDSKCMLPILDALGLDTVMRSSKQDKNNWLIEAARKGQIRLATILLWFGAEVDAQDNGEGGFTALRCAARNGHSDIVNLLIRSKATCGYIDLMWAVYNGHTDTVKVLIENGVDADAKNGKGSTALHAAALWGQTKIIRILITHGADVNAKNGEGFTALHAAVLGRQTEILRILIAHGADINAQDKYGSNPLYLAALKKNTEIIKILLEKGADIRCGNSAFYWREIYGNKEAEEKLLQHLPWHKRTEYWIQVNPIKTAAMVFAGATGLYGGLRYIYINKFCTPKIK